MLTIRRNVLLTGASEVALHLLLDGVFLPEQA